MDKTNQFKVGGRYDYDQHGIFHALVEIKQIVNSDEFIVIVINDFSSIYRSIPLGEQSRAWHRCAGTWTYLEGQDKLNE